jgi:hypothetical protein
MYRSAVSSSRPMVSVCACSRSPNSERMAIRRMQERTSAKASTVCPGCQPANIRWISSTMIGT